MAAIQPISEKIRSFRSKNNLSQQDFAFLCGISTSYLSQIENAAANPSLILLERISSVLGTTVGDSGNARAAIGKTYDGFPFLLCDVTCGYCG